jgi:hypothetical protein
MTHRAAHPRLLHGFLVPMATNSTLGTRRSPAAAAAAPKAATRVQRAADAKYEGPADDTTFH